MDKRARTYDDTEPHPVGNQIDTYLGSLAWVETAKSRIRDEGHVFHIEAFVVPSGDTPTLEQLETTRQACIELDWKAKDTVLIPVSTLPAEFLPGIPAEAG